MYRDSFEPSPWRRRLNTTWPLFRLLGVDVRISWTIVIVPLVFLLTVGQWNASPGAKIGVALFWTIGLYACVYVHEMGHILMGRRLGVGSRRMTLRALGGLAHMDSPAPDPKGEILIALAGPATHLLWLAVLYPAWLAVEHFVPGQAPWIEFGLRWFVGLQVALFVFNLMPFYPLDGGRVLRGLLARTGKRHANHASMLTAQVGMAGALVLGLAGLTGMFGQDHDAFGLGDFSFFLVWIGIGNWFACRRLMVEARWSDGPYAPTEAWKRGMHQQDPWAESLAESARLTEQAEKAERKEAEQERKRRSQRDALQARVDALLDRINEVGGIENLSAAERKELATASEQLRNRDDA